MKQDITTGVIYRITNVISNYFLINLLWLLFSIPVVYLVLILMTVENIPDMLTLCIILSLFMPFTFFPATTGMFAVVRRWVMKEADVPIWQSFWKYYKYNYVKSMMGGIVLTIIWFIFLADFYYLVILFNKQFLILFVPLFIIIFVFTLNFFSALVHFEERVGTLMKNAIIFTISRPFLTLGTTGVCLVILYVSVTFPFIFLVCSGSLVTFVSYTGFNNIYLKIKETQENV